MRSADIDIIIVAAGSGSRFGSSLPKQFCVLAERPVLMHTVDVFRSALPDARITLVLSADMADYWSELCVAHAFDSPAVVYGGSSRWESVRNALNSIDALRPVVMIHDGARPLVDAALIERVAGAFCDHGVDGVIPAVALTDSIREVRPDGASTAVDRSKFRAVQTPQAFRSQIIREAYLMPYESTFTDDASVVEATGAANIVIVEGSTSNIKITNPLDIRIAELLLNADR